MKLSLLEANGWDTVEVRQRVNILHYIDHIALSLEKVGAAMDLVQEQGPRKSFQTDASRAMRGFRGWYEAMIAPTASHNTSQDQPLVTGIQDFMNLDHFDYFDDAYFFQMMGDNNFTQ